MEPEDVKMMFKPGDLKALCRILTDAALAHPKNSCALKPATWEVFDDGSVSLSVAGKTLTEIDAHLEGY